MGWFSYNGYKTSELGIIVEQMPSFPRAPRRVTTYTIPGRSGSPTVTDNAFETISAQSRINLQGKQSRDFICSWLAFSGNLILSDDPTRCFRVKINDYLQFERFFINGKDYSSCIVNFMAEPFRYLSNPTTINAQSGDTLSNPGSWFSEPLIRIRGSGSATLNIGGEDYEFTGLSTAVDFVIDSEAGKAYLDGGTATAQMAGDTFPQIPTGNSTITFTGLTKCEIAPNWRWL